MKRVSSPYWTTDSRLDFGRLPDRTALFADWPGDDAEGTQLAAAEQLLARALQSFKALCVEGPVVAATVV